MSAPTRHFIIVFDRVLGKQVRFEELRSVEEATELYRKLERESLERDSQDQDVVLVGSDSPESVRITHSSYFVDEPSDFPNIKRYLDAFAQSHGAQGVNRRRIRKPRVHHDQLRLVNAPIEA